MSNVEVRITADVTSLTAQLAVAKAELSNASSDLRKMASAMNEAGNAATSEMKAGLLQAAEATATARAEVSALNNELKIKGGGGALETMREHLEGMLAPINNVKAALAGIGELVIGAFAIHQVIEFVEHIAEAGAQMLKLSQQTGVSVETLSGWHYSADQADVSADALDTTLKRLGQSIQSALHEPTGKAAEAFKAMGFTMEELKAHANDEEYVILKAADAFHEHAAGTNAAAVAQAAFGRGAVEILPWLQQGRDVIQQQIERNKELGGQLTGEMGEAFHEHLKAVKDMNVAWDSVARDLTSLVLPALTATATALSTAIGGMREMVTLAASFNPVALGMKAAGAITGQSVVAGEAPAAKKEPESERPEFGNIGEKAAHEAKGRQIDVLKELAETDRYLSEESMRYAEKKWREETKDLVGSSRVDLQACKLEYSIVSPK